jgi:large subunit ribosomal protein L21
MNINKGNIIKKFSIVQASGRQYLFEPGKWYDINKLFGNDDDIVKLEQLLFHQNNERIFIGKPCLEKNILLGTLIQHFRGKKICIVKYKPKKRYRRKIGFRPSLSRILIKRSFEKVKN